MKIYFDNNSISYLINNSRWNNCLSMVRTLVDKNRIQIIGSITILKELAGIAENHPQLYRYTINKYKDLVKSNFVLEWMQLIKEEIKQKSKISDELLYYSEDKVERIYGEMLVINKAISAYNDFIKKEKHKYQQQMKNSIDNLLSKPEIKEDSKKDRISNVKKWFSEDYDSLEQFHFQHIFKTNNLSLKQLPHTRSLISFYLTKIFERLTKNKKYRGTDFHDRAHFIEATSADFLITCDRKFLNTCKSAKFVNYEIRDLDSFCDLINDMHAV